MTQEDEQMYYDNWIESLEDDNDAMEQGLHNRPEAHKESGVWKKVHCNRCDVSNTNGNGAIRGGW